jgi:hypothetical protein
MVSISYLNKHFNSEKIPMLKIRTLILVLSLTPLLSLNWQLPSQAQKSPSVGTAGGQSGGGTTGSSVTPYSNPNFSNPFISLPPQAQVSPESVAALTNALLELNTPGSVNTAKVNIAIQAYNDIIQQSSPETLQALSQNKDFLDTGAMLKGLARNL